jgi:DNA uptake protein ComE-like DNA-binding protein
VGELAAFAELRGEALGQRIDELERRLKGLEAIEQRLSTLDGRLEGVEAAVEPLADIPGRLDRVEALAAEAWQREQAAVEQQREAMEAVEELEGLAKLNEASFEQLRALGLSGTQAARLLAAREARSGFDTVDELAGVPGFPPALITELKQLVES